jgi:hypothetical protein
VVWAACEGSMTWWVQASLPARRAERPVTTGSHGSLTTSANRHHVFLELEERLRMRSNRCTPVCSAMPPPDTAGSSIHANGDGSNR